MSSALWHFFWTEADWTGTTVPPVVDVPRGAGGGRKKQRKYARLDEDFWLARERYLARMQRVEEVSVAVKLPPTGNEMLPEPPAEMVDTTAIKLARDAALMAAYNAKTRAELQRLGGEVAELSARMRRMARDEDDFAYVLLTML